MDALSTLATTLRAGGGGAFLAATPREPLLLRTASNTTAHIPPFPNLSNKPPSFSLSQPIGSRLHSSILTAASSAPISPTLPCSPWPKTSTITYKRASTGYAAALLDIAQCSNITDVVERDARRFLRAIRSVLAEQPLDDEKRGEAVKRVVESGGFCKHLVVLARMLVGKGKAGLVAEVMEEFGRTCDELSGTRVVLVSSEERMEEDELAGIAEEVRRMSGAMRVKVRHVVCQNSSPSPVFAV